MSLQFLGKDPNSDEDNCPSVWVDTDSKEIVVQGWLPSSATLAECLEAGSIPDTEGVIRLPARMTALLMEACNALGPAAL